ncbi:MAG: kelch repeat-containing protein, partial [Flavobacteriaceae bacterium]
MKTTRISVLGFMAIALFGCKKSDDSPEVDPVNKAPNAFNLVEVANGANGIGYLPTLSWQVAVDPDGDAVSYDVFLDTTASPATLLAGGLSVTTVTVTTSLERATNYSWKVVAKDAEGNTTSSSVFNFTTQGLTAPTTPVAAAAEFSARAGHTSAVFDDKIWVIGGEDDDGFQNDVWSSTDGATWSLIGANANFSKRTSHATVVFNNQLVVMGGTALQTIDNGPGLPPTQELEYLDDVWVSDNGADWTETASTSFGGRDGLTAAVLNNKIYVMGGYDGVEYKNDVWSSVDGIVWVQETASATFPARSGHATTVFDGKIWVVGGWNGNLNFKDAWSSTDGVTWVQATDSAPFSAASVNMTLSSFQDKLWVIGGFSTTSVKNIWFSADGVSWGQSFPEANFEVRGEHTA